MPKDKNSIIVDPMVHSASLRCPTGSPELDYVLKEGIPPGRLPMFYGKEFTKPAGLEITITDGDDPNDTKDKGPRDE